MSWDRDTPLFITAAAGTEVALKAELRDLGLSGAKGARGGVRVRGGLEAITRVCYRSRIAVRVLIEIADFPCGDERALDKGVGALPWDRWLTPEHTLAVRATSRASRLDHTGFVAQRTKDAIVDAQRRVCGFRSSVDKKDPDLGVVVRIDRDRATVSLDASGASLHRRGWRLEDGPAPLKETLAAAALRISGWDRERPLVDPLCGAGTLPIEAELWARGVPAQRAERRFGFERWADHDEDAAARAARERASGAARAKEDGPSCRGSDADPQIVEVAAANAERAGSRATFSVADLRDVELEEGAHVIANPPYGERLDATDVWAPLDAAVTRWWSRGHPVSLLLPDDAPRLGPDSEAPLRHALFNGALRCHLVTWGKPTKD
ncbi:MAG: RNA methyltransferase [Sandaracinaceae bacterium]|nr:RNA methyltransferase [Sandaracinaceae bacterium]